MPSIKRKVSVSVECNVSILSCDVCGTEAVNGAILDDNCQEIDCEFPLPEVGDGWHIVFVEAKVYGKPHTKAHEATYFLCPDCRDTPVRPVGK